MKTTIYTLLISTCITFAASLRVQAQTATSPTVYLKNGSIISGELKQDMVNGTIKIKTGDGSMLVYNQTDVDSIIYRTTTNVYLKNGSLIKGEVKQNMKEESVKIKTSDGNKLFYNLAEVDSIVFTAIAISKKSFSLNKFGFKQKGLWSLTELNVGFGGDYKQPISGVSTIFGYRLLPQLAVGGGVGFDMYFQGTTFRGYSLAIFADARYFMSQRRVSPFAGLQVGYALASINIPEDTVVNTNVPRSAIAGGLYFSPLFGIRIFVHKSIALNFALSYQLRQLTNKDNDPVYTNYFALKFGVSF